MIIITQYDITVIVGTMKVWAWPMKNITQKLASLFLDDDEVLVWKSLNKLSDLPEMLSTSCYEI